MRKYRRFDENLEGQAVGKAIFAIGKKGSKTMLKPTSRFSPRQTGGDCRRFASWMSRFCRAIMRIFRRFYVKSTRFFATSDKKCPSTLK